MKFELLPIATVRSLSVEDQDALIQESVAIQNRMMTAQETHKSSFPMTGKLMCIAEERLNELKSNTDANGQPKKRLIAANTSFSTYWESLTRKNGKVGSGVKPNSHAYSCCVTFGTYVRSELITEADYDKNTSQCLELAASIATACGGDVSHTAVIDAADELKDRSKDSAKNLRNILADVKEPKAMTPEKARELIATLLKGGFLTSVVIPAIGAEIAHLTDSEVARSAFMALDTANCMFAQNVDENNVRRFSDTVLDAWCFEISLVTMTPEAAEAARKAFAEKKAREQAAQNEQAPQPEAPAPEKVAA